ncbi:chaperone protein dnaJ 11, chloroplastic-like [Zingiber officinale]|uniref:J domain-containing protein n=1 Tax=Zingiber officinale TaxID=94328 RepID=A0A8J5F2K2_ZINOF|nr:chaperone protein dnaJ 11, chloroplastic-like [Zingiber officinale]KAG6476483.1 hypothetical protein ZIOFF_065725 [Zingiber officinale]
MDNVLLNPSSAQCSDCISIKGRLRTNFQPLPSSLCVANMVHALSFSPSKFLALPRPPVVLRPSFVVLAAAVRSPAESSMSLYEVLGVHAGALNGEIKAAYRRLALECHPDVGAPADEFLRLHAAYATLSDPDKRADYDRQLMALDRQRRDRRSTYTGTRPPLSRGSHRRTWETDQCW